MQAAPVNGPIAPATPLPAPARAGSAAPPALAGKLDPNTASSADLLAIPGVDPVLASRILAARPFKSAEDLRNVKGIGPKKYEQIRSYFTPQ